MRQLLRYRIANDDAGFEDQTMPTVEVLNSDYENIYYHPSVHYGDVSLMMTRLGFTKCMEGYFKHNALESFTDVISLLTLEGMVHYIKE